MIPAETLVLFFFASVALALAPGPDNIFVMLQSAMAGRSAGLAVTAGLCSGLLVHTAAVAFGVAAIFQSSATAFTLLKLVGAAYLVYLAWRAFTAGPVDAEADGVERSGWLPLYLRGVVMNVSNPKVAIFFLAFLPQFADPAHGSLTVQILFLGAVFIVASILVFSAIAIAAATVRRHFVDSDKVQRLVNRLAGIVFVGLALRLAMTTR